MLELKEKGQLTPDQVNVFIHPTPEKELYDLENDPFELENLAMDPDFADELERMRMVLKEYMDSTEDIIPAVRTSDEFDRVTGAPLPNRQWPRPGKFEREEMIRSCDEPL